jgi:hypothetical protein
MTLCAFLLVMDVFQVFLKVTDMAGQDETDSLTDSHREDGEDEAANHELSESHATNSSVVDSEGHDVEMMDIAGHDEAGLYDDDPLLKLDHRGVEQTDAGKFLWIALSKLFSLETE